MKVFHIFQINDYNVNVDNIEAVCKRVTYIVFEGIVLLTNMFK